MKLGVDGLLPDWQSIDVEAARRVRSAGFLGATMRFNRPLETSFDEVRGLKHILDDAGLEAAQINGWYEVLVHPDEAKRAEGVRGLQRMVQFASLLNAETVYVRPGSLNERGAWYPHLDNHIPATFERLIDSLVQVCRTSEQEGVPLAIEGHVLSPLDTAQHMADLILAVGSPHLTFNADPVNFIGSVYDVHDTRPVLNQLFDLLGPVTTVGHAKDLRLEDKLVLHIQECLLGTGTLDYSLFLRRFQACCPNGYLLIEHLPNEQVPLARAALLKYAEREGIVFEF